jgi:hypothetical protein
MRGSATNLDIRSVGLENTGHRILAAPVVITIVVIAVIIVVPVAHTLVVLTVSHVLPLFQPRVKSVGLMVCDVRGATQAHHVYRSAIPLQAVTLSSTVAFNKDAFLNSLRPPANHSFSLPQQARLSCVSRQAQFRLSFTLRSEAAQL